MAINKVDVEYDRKSAASYYKPWRECVVVVIVWPPGIPRASIIERVGIAENIRSSSRTRVPKARGRRRLIFFNISRCLHFIPIGARCPVPQERNATQSGIIIQQGSQQVSTAGGSFHLDTAYLSSLFWRIPVRFMVMTITITRSLFGRSLSFVLMIQF